MTSSSGLPSCKVGLGPSTCRVKRQEVSQSHPPGTLGSPCPPSGDIGAPAHLEHLRWFLAVHHNLQVSLATSLAIPDGRGQLLRPAALQHVAPGPAPDEEGLGTGRGTVVTEPSHLPQATMVAPQPTSPRLRMKQLLRLKLTQGDAPMDKWTP